MKKFYFCIVVLNNNLGGYSFGETIDGRPGFRKPGADAVTPFINDVTISEDYKKSVSAGGTISFAAPRDYSFLFITRDCSLSETLITDSRFVLRSGHKGDTITYKTSGSYTSTWREYLIG